MKRALALATVFVSLLVPATRADEADDLLARRLSAIVRDPRLTVPQRVEAARILGKMGLRAGAAVPDLAAQLNRLRGPELEPLQEAVIDTLGQIGSPSKDALPSLARAKGRSIDIDVAIHRANESILAASDSQDIVALIKQLQSRDSSIRLRAVKALGNLGPAARYAVTDLTSTLNDPDPDVRRAAISALNAVQPDAPPSEQLVRAIALDLRAPDAGARLLALRSLMRFGRRAAIVVADVEPLLTDADPDVRKAAADLIARIAP